AISSSIGPLDRRHQSATSASKTTTPSVPPTMASLRSRGYHARHRGLHVRGRTRPLRRHVVEEIGEDAQTRATSPSWAEASCPHNFFLRLASSFRRASRLG